jgi:hypothetical protein
MASWCHASERPCSALWRFPGVSTGAFSTPLGSSSGLPLRQGHFFAFLGESYGVPLPLPLWKPIRGCVVEFGPLPFQQAPPGCLFWGLAAGWGLFVGLRRSADPLKLLGRGRELSADLLGRCYPTSRPWGDAG